MIRHAQASGSHRRAAQSPGNDATSQTYIYGARPTPLAINQPDTSPNIRIEEQLKETGPRIGKEPLDQRTIAFIITLEGGRRSQRGICILMNPEKVMLRY